MLRAAREMLAAEPDWTSERLEADFRAYCETNGVGLGKIAQPVRVAVTGKSASPPLFEMLSLLGRERSLSRMDAALDSIAAAGQGA